MLLVSVTELPDIVTVLSRATCCWQAVSVLCSIHCECPCMLLSLLYMHSCFANALNPKCAMHKTVQALARLLPCSIGNFKC